MRTRITKRISALLIVIILTVLFAPSLFTLSGLADSKEVKADSLINLSVKANNTEPGVGDILTVSIIADNFPQIVRFGTMKIHYDENLAEYISVDIGSDIPSFVNNVSLDGSFINVSAVDQYFQDAGADGESVSTEDRAFSFDSPTILFTISFRIKEGASGQIPFWIDSQGEFINADGETVSSVVDNSISVTISDRVSDDANLVLLKVNTTELEPAFSPDVTDYQATVERQVTDATVTATPSNLWASVVINGNNNLQIGNNIITIIVTAQDGVTTKEYHIALKRRESVIPDNALLADSQGMTYTFVDVPASFTPPEGFTQKMKTINEFSVPAYVRDGVNSVLLYLYDGENPPGLYLYNADLKTVVPYDRSITYLSKSRILLKTEIPADIEIPKEYLPEVREIGGVSLSGFIDEEGQFICYLADETGEAQFYVYDDIDNMFHRYVPVDKTMEKTYSALMVVFMIISAIEALFLVVIVLIVHKVISHRNNPRPRHV